MSAIFGIIDLKGNAIEPVWIESMRTDLAHRGPDREGLFQEPGVVLGHKLLQVTPESIYDRSPYEEDGFVITANARLDEREAIMDRLQIPQFERDRITDPLLLLRSFRKYGKDFVKNIYGDFAFAIWDKKRRELFCARDQMGVKPFLYNFQDGRFAFSTELKSLVKLPFLITEAETISLRDEAMGIYDSPTKTAWKNIWRLHAAHHLKLNSKGLNFHRYWDLIPKENPLYKTEEQSAKVLQEILVRVIDDQTRVIGEVGVPLSGGLDSSTITCIAARKFAKENKIVYTSSSVLDPKVDLKDFKDEMEYISEVLHQEKNIKPAFIYHTELEFLKDLDAKFERHYTPVVHSHYVDEALNIQFELNSVRRVLSGTLGDMTTSNSTILPLPNLLINGRLKTFFQLIRKYQKNMKLPFWPLLRRNVVQPTIPIFLQELFYFLLGKKSPWDVSDLPLPIDKFKKKLIQKRMKSIFENYYFNTFSIKNNIWSTDTENLGEGWDCGPSHHGLEYTYPLFDRRIVEFLVQIPVEHFYAGGLKRGLIRKAMVGILPEKIRLRMDKLPYSPADEIINKRDILKIEDLLKNESLIDELKNVLNIEKVIFLIKEVSESKKSRKFHKNYWMVIDLTVLVKYLNWYTTKKSK